MNITQKKEIFSLAWVFYAMQVRAGIRNHITCDLALTKTKILSFLQKFHH